MTIIDIPIIPIENEKEKDVPTVVAIDDGRVRITTPDGVVIEQDGKARIYSSTLNRTRIFLESLIEIINDANVPEMTWAEYAKSLTATKPTIVEKIIQEVVEIRKVDLTGVRDL